MIVLLALAPALGQDSPWGEAPDAGPWGETPEEAPAEPIPTEAVPAEAAPVDAPAVEEAEEPPPMKAPREPRARGENQASEGWRIAPFAATSGAKVAQELVVGGTGGTNATTISARWGTERFGFAVGVPFTAYRTPDGRTTDLGNLQLDGWYRLGGSGGLEQTIGLELHGRVAEPAWTWTNRSDDLWPGYGADVVWQGRTTPSEKTTLLYRGSLGVHGAAGYEPFPSTYLRVGAAMGVDRTLSSVFGLVGEASVTYWDLSPMDLTGLVRIDPLPGVRARAGFVMPTFVWFGITPSDQASGLRETTAVIDLTVVL